MKRKLLYIGFPLTRKRAHMHGGRKDSPMQTGHNPRERTDMTDERKPQEGTFKQLLRSGKYTQARICEDDFLSTPEWQKLRERRMLIDGFRCRKCGSPFNLEVHHTRYPLVWGEENPQRDLVTLCDKCHRSIHDGQDKQR